MQPEEDLIKQKLKKRNELLEQGIDPYAHKFDKKNNTIDLLKKKTAKNVSIAGRIISFRPMGKAAFGHIQDQFGKIQFYIKEELIKNYEVVKKLDLGDFIGIKGSLFKTKTGEITIKTSSLTLLTKSLRPLPAKWHGLKDQETRYRQRYVDLIVNPTVKETFLKRSKIIEAMRTFLTKNGYIEVETPILQPIYGGTSARPFKSNLNALNMDVYMRISNELYLKRLLVGGYEKIFEFSPDFRNEGIDKTHNPEFLQMETMWTYADYKDNMDFCEEMIEFIVKSVFKTTKVSYQNKTIEFKRPWKRMTMKEAIKNIANIDLDKLSDKEVKDILEKNKLEYNKENFSKINVMEPLFEHFVEPKLIQPTLIYDYPAITSPLAKSKQENPEIAERFEPYINGWELGNSYSELNDPILLKEIWEKEEKKLKKGDEEAQRMDKDFLRALEIGMPPASGLGIGIDRLVILLTNSQSIRDVILFPFMKPE